jgi:hypothetical protein
MKIAAVSEDGVTISQHFEQGQRSRIEPEHC